MFLLFINTHFRLTYAGFFAKRQIMFFLSSSFRFCQPLKNDGRDELRFREVVNDFLYKRKNRECKPSPLVGEGGGEAVRRGKLEQKRKNEKNEWVKCGRMERNLLYAEQYFSIYGKIII